MKLVQKIWLGIGIAVVAALLIFGLTSYQNARRTVESELLEQGRSLRDTLLAVRRTYLRQFLESGLPLNDQTIGFLPAHAMSRIAKDHQALGKQGILFANVSDRPRNPANQADAVELQAIGHFRAHPDAQERLTQFEGPDGQRYYHYATPIWTETYCLKCHGDPQAAPPAVRERYDTAFGYQVGDLRGILSIKLPAGAAEHRILGNWLREQATHIGSMLLAVLVGGLLMHFMVVRKLHWFHQGVRRVAAGDYADRLQVTGNDETAELASSFNRMAEALRRREEQLQQSAIVFENSQEGIIIADVNGTIVDVNRAFCTITGYDRDSVIGQNPRLLKSGRHDDLFYRALWRTLQHAGQWKGEIWNRRANGEIYPEWLSISAVRDPQGQLTHYVAVFADISDLRRSQDELEHQAHHDPLTGLPNRLLLQAHLERALPQADRDGSLVSLLFLDLDRFKHVNDSLGHVVGDRLLQSVSARLRELVRGGDVVARLGGDEFLVVMEQLRTAEDAAVLASKLNQAMAEPFMLDGQEFYLTSSIGISLYPRDGRDLEILLRNADAAMYRAKEAGRNTYQFYTQELTVSAFERMTLETLLRGALARQEFELHFQPQVDLASGRVTGAEALLRWRHPDLGLVSPDRFIPLAEDTGLIIPIGEWVLRTACAQAKAWTDRNLFRGSIAVNVAGPQLLRSDFVTTVRRTLAETGLPPSRLELEVTESFVMDQAESAIQILLDLRHLGISLAIDDFGTGYSSLAYLKRLPIQKLKIDRGFVRDLPDDPDDTAITLAVIALGHSLGLSIIAEGVETEAQQSLLLSKECEEAQGYLFSRPLPIVEMTDYLRRASAAETDWPN